MPSAGDDGNKRLTVIPLLAETYKSNGVDPQRYVTLPGLKVTVVCGPRLLVVDGAA